MASAIAKNKYVAVVIPFIVYLCHENLVGYMVFLPIIFRLRLKGIFFPYHPNEWLSGIPKSLGIFMLWISVSSVLFDVVMRKRMKG